MSEKKENHSNKLPVVMILALILLVGGIMTYRQMHTSSATTCQVVPQSAFGQGQGQTWVQMNTAQQAANGAGFDIEYPHDAVNTEYDSVQYWSYTQQIVEHRYFQGDKEVYRFAKGRMCGKPLYTPDSAYASTVIAQIDGKEVTEYGDGTTVTAASWTDGQYSYFIGAFGSPVSKEEMEALVTKVK